MSINYLKNKQDRLRDRDGIELLERFVGQAKEEKEANAQTNVKSKGTVECIVEYKDGSQEILDFNNTILQNGKIALANSITNAVNDPFDFYVNSMVFGTQGASGGTPKFVDASRTGLFGPTLLTKNVISSIDTAAPTTAIFTSVITFTEANGNALNEMGLKLKNGDIYSMLTFPDLNKTSLMQLTFNWRISFL